jgi:hypothetical protein
MLNSARIFSADERAKGSLSTPGNTVYYARRSSELQPKSSTGTTGALFYLEGKLRAALCQDVFNQQWKGKRYAQKLKNVS